jgi:hypothetical protein
VFLAGRTGACLTHTSAVSGEIHEYNCEVGSATVWGRAHTGHGGRVCGGDVMGLVWRG